MAALCSPPALFSDRKGNHKFSKWHQTLRSFALLPTKQVVYMAQLAIVFCLVLASEKKCSVLRADQGLLQQGSLGPWAAALGGGGCSLLGGAPSHSNGRLCQKSRFADRAWPLFLPAGSPAVFPVEWGSEKVKANIFFPLRRIKIFHPAQETISPLALGQAC